MNKKIITVIGIIIIAAIIAAILLNAPSSKDDTKIKMLSKSSLKEDSSIKIELTDSNSTPIDNKTISIKIINKKGKVDEYSVKTDKNGQAKLKLNKIKPGTYRVNFTYDGDDVYNSSNLSKKIKIVKKVVKKPKTNDEQVTQEESSSSSSNSEDDGYWESSIDAPYEYHTEYDSNGGFRQYDRAGNLVGSSYDEDQDDIADYVPKRL